MEPARAAVSSTDAEDFVRFCYRRRRVGWPELYDEMCLVATRGAYKGMGRGELAEVGIGFSLFETRQLAELVTRVVAQEQAERARMPRIVRADDARPARPAEPVPGETPAPAVAATTEEEPAGPVLRHLVTVAAGA